MPKQTIIIEKEFSKKRPHSKISIHVARDDLLGDTGSINDSDGKIYSLINEAITQLGAKIDVIDSTQTTNDSESDPKRPKTDSSETSTVSSSEPVQPPQPLQPIIRKFTKSSYDEVITFPARIADYNLFGLDVFGSTADSLQLRSKINGDSNSRKLYMHIANHLEIDSEAECETLITHLSLRFGSETFKLIVSTAAASHKILDDFIKNGTNAAAINNLCAQYGSDTITFLLDEMHLMKTSLNMEVVKAFINKSNVKIIHKLFDVIRHHLHPVTSKNIIEMGEIAKHTRESKAYTVAGKAQILDALFKTPS